MGTELILRFGYGAVVPWVTSLEDGGIRAIAGPDMMVLRTPVQIGENIYGPRSFFEVSTSQMSPDWRV